MDPVLTLAAIAAKWGVKQVALALMKNDEVAGLLSEITGGIYSLVQQGSRAQSDLFEVRRELASIQSDVRFLVDQRYMVAQTSASRYLEQSLLQDREPVDRERDLDSAERLLVDAAHSATTALDRALSERLLVIVRLARGDGAGARHAIDQLGLCVGNAAHELRAWTQDETRPSGLLAVLAQDLIGGMTLTGMSSVGSEVAAASVGVGEGNFGLVVEVGLGSVNFAGFTCELGGFTETHLDGGSSAAASSATVAIDSRRSANVEAWVGACQVGAGGSHTCLQSPYEANVHQVSPGERATLEGFHWFDAREPVRQCVVVGGISFSAAMPHQT